MIRIVGRVGYGIVILLALVGIISVAGRFVGTVQYLADPAAVDLDHRRKPLHLQDMIPNQAGQATVERASLAPPENFAINAIVAEVWINVTRRQPLVLPASVAPREHVLQATT